MAESSYVELVPVYSGGMIFLSWAVSVVGSWTTLEILLRRTGNAGMMNVLLLLGAGIAFGSTATFGMHFVGNQSLTLKLPPPWEGQGVPLSYSPSYTILSLIISCLCMILAFSFIGLRFNAPSPKLPAEGDDLEVVDSLEDGDKFDGDATLDDKVRPTTAQTDKTSRFNNLSSALPKTKSGWESSAKEKQRVEDGKEDDEEARDDGGDFGVHAARVSKAGVAKILGAGVICGGGIAAMHYVGQVSINSVPRITNDWYTIFASILIAMLAVSLGLYILFVVFRPKLQHSWYKRLAVAMILGAGVTAMHFVALVGTHYFAKEGTDLATPADNTTKKIIISIICVVAPICCISLVIFAWFAQLRHARQRAARHRIILSTAIFDHQGLLLVQPESGLLPSARIYPSSTPEDKPSLLSSFGFGTRLRLDSSKVKLSRSDPAFVAFLQESWNWRNNRRPSKFSDNTDRQTQSIDFEAGGTGDSVGFEGASDKRTELSEAEMLRRSLLSFQMASEDIAMQIGGSGEDLRCLGVLYDSILKTGHYQVSSKTSNDKFTVTQGQMLVLARRLKSATERDNLLAQGFVFAEPGAVARLTSNALACPYDRVFDFFRDVYRFTRFGVVKKLDRGRLYGGLLLLQALPGEGLQVVVDEKMHHSLPMTEVALLVDSSSDRSKLPSTSLPITTLESIVEGLRSLGGRSLEELSTSPPQTTLHGPVSQLQFLVANVLRPYLDKVLSAATTSSLASRLILTPTIIPLSSRSGPPFGADGIVKDSYLLCIKAVVPSSVSIPGRPLNWLPFQLYRAQSQSVAQVPATASNRPETGVSTNSTSSPFDGKSHGSSSAGHDRFDEDLPFPLSNASPFSSSAFPPSGATNPFPSSHHARTRTITAASAQSTVTFPRTGGTQLDGTHSNFASSSQPSTFSSGSSAVPSFSPDWVVELVKNTVAGQESQGWRSWDVPVPGRCPPRGRTTSNPVHERL
ncbi:hypothetical protein JCM3765_007129 [Sporobolomyces pararoseus]